MNLDEACWKLRLEAIVSSIRRGKVVRELVVTAGLLLLAVLLWKGWHRWSTSAVESDPLSTARSELADRHRERTMALSKLRQLEKVPEALRTTAAKLEGRYREEYVAAEEKFADQRDVVRRLGGTWILFGPDDAIEPSATEPAGGTAEARQSMEYERTTVRRRLASIERFAREWDDHRDRLDRLIARTREEIRYWDDLLGPSDTVTTGGTLSGSVRR